MNREDIIRLMQEVDPEMIINIQDHGGNMEDFTGEYPKLLQFWPFKNYVKFAALVAAAEREACAKVCEGISKDPWTKVGREHAPYMEATAIDCAETIRKRGEVKP